MYIVGAHITSSIGKNSTQETNHQNKVKGPIKVYLQGIESTPQKSPASPILAGSKPSPPLISTKSDAPSPRHWINSDN